MINFIANKEVCIFIAGHNGMLGSAIYRQLLNQGFTNVVVANRIELDLLNAESVELFFQKNKPQIVILAAALVGGINANIESPVDFLEHNLRIQLNVISTSHKHNVNKFVFIGSSCIYPTDCSQPMVEEYLMSGPLEPTNEAYALAKIVGIKQLQFYKKQYEFNSICLMPCNLYGPNDSFDLTKSHVLSALVKRFVDAKDASKESVTLWGTGEARREFMHVDDAARAVVYFIDKFDSMDTLNVGPGVDISIFDLANLISKYVGYNGIILWDTEKPNGMLRKCMDVTKMKNYGFEPLISLDEGILQMIDIYSKNTIIKK